MTGAVPVKMKFASETAGRAEFRIKAEPSPQLLLRVLGLLAQQDRLPDRATVEVAETTLAINLILGSVSRHRAEVLAEKMRSMVDTEFVHLAWRS